MMKYEGMGRKVSTDPKCIGWAQAQASLWGHASDHDLDEPVRLSERMYLRVRWRDDELLLDRDLTLKTTRAGTHAALRFEFVTGKFFEVNVEGISAVALLDRTVEITRAL